MTTNLPKDMERELAGLADGSLTDGKRARALERVRGSQELEAALAEQRRAIDLMAGVDVQAPPSLHRRVETILTPTRRERVFAAPRVWFAVATTALAVAVVTVSLIGGSHGTRIGVEQAAALTLSPATMPAPTESEAHRNQLAVSVDGVSFPYWKEDFGWRSSGSRNDLLGGRSVTTVFYTNSAGRRIGYAIVSGPAPTTNRGKLVRRWGTTYRLLVHDGATVVTWQRDGHLCIVSGREVSATTLLNLAGWNSEKRGAA